jgi:hypothetical protein
VPKVDRLLVKMLARLGPMGNESPMAQISGGKAASFANALSLLRSLRRAKDNAFHLCSGYRPSVSEKAPINPVTKPSQIILDKGLVLDKESRA